MKKILDEAGFLASANDSFRSIPAPFQFKPVACGNRFAPKGVNSTCYSLEASANTLLPALVMFTGTYEEASMMIGNRTDRIRITAQTNPSCSFIQTDIKSLAPAMVGPGSIKVTNYHSRKATKNLLLGASTSISSKILPIGNATLDVSHEFNRNLMNEKGSGEGIRFRAPAGQTCVPSVVNTLFICKGFKGDFAIGKLGRSALTKEKTVPRMPIPLFSDGVVMASHYGCIDYS
ncbi:hypothetical protein DSO57_1009575 [Entomophthora muscae]|uniref:Uncharacterized protein n=2 Tax=Entomophthora muscae TaxID=34485 RepID=A0ACC2TTR9_9FUNG|nr:hypothetical protein DSO57_1016108 [Entomophthora muscae]KAJ9078160.1 hypothetical protein DSO57_1009575 [Entomophthora muscae]